MTEKISFVNNTNSQIIINGMAANVMSLCQDAIDCANGSYVINPGIGFATLSNSNLPLFQLSTPDFVFNVLLSTASTSQTPLPEDVLGGANQANYAGTLFLDAGVYTVLIQDLTTVQSVTFVNNTSDVINLRNIGETSIDEEAFIFSPNNSYPIPSQKSATATIENLSFFETFQVYGPDFTFNVVLGINSIMPDLNPPANQNNYVAGLSYSNNEYVITVSKIDSTNSVIFQNQTGEEIRIEPIGNLNGAPFFTDLHDGLIQTVDQSYAILPGIGSATVNSSITMFQVTTEDFAFIFTLNGAGKVILPELKGVNQSKFAANISQNGSQYTIVVSPSPLFPTINFINNTQDVIYIAKEVNDPNAITDCLNNLHCSSGSFVLNPGAGSCQIGDLPINQSFQVSATDFTFAVNLSDPGKILPTTSADYVGLVNQIGNLYTVVIEKGATPPGPGTPYSFTFTGSVGETLFSESLTQADFISILKMGREPTSLSVSLTGTNSATLTSCGCTWACTDTTDNCSECNLLNINTPSVFFLCSTSTGLVADTLQLHLQLNSDPMAITVSTGIDLTQTETPFVFPLNSNGNVTVVLSNSQTETLPLTQTLNLGATYSFTSENDTGSLKKYNVGTISSTGTFSFMFASTIPNTFNNTMEVSGTINIQDTNGVPITFTISESQQSSLSGTASFGSIKNVSFSGNIEISSGNVLITINGNISGPLPQFVNTNNLTGNVSLNFTQ